MYIHVVVDIPITCCYLSNEKFVLEAKFAAGNEMKRGRTGGKQLTRPCRDQEGPRLLQEEGKKCCQNGI